LIYKKQKHFLAHQQNALERGSDTEKNSDLPQANEIQVMGNVILLLKSGTYNSAQDFW